MIAHVSGIPVEELMPLAFVGGTAASSWSGSGCGCGFALE
jgi:hypothetical protein